MFFVDVVMMAHLVEQRIGLRQGEGVLGGEKGGEPPLPEVMSALNLALGLRSGRIAQGDFLEAQGRPELRKGLGPVREEEGVIIDIEGQGQATGLESAGEEIQWSQ